MIEKEREIKLKRWKGERIGCVRIKIANNRKEKELRESKKHKRGVRVRGRGGEKVDILIY